MIGWTLCSGIGAPEVAAPWVDWRMAAEIEPFPRDVLQQRFGYKLPEDHNQGDPLLWGDMTEVTPELARSSGVPLPDLLVAGTPCQAFSIAGLRGGTADARGNLTLKFVETCHAIVDARPDGKLAVLWENVPGVLSDKGNAFGCFLGGLVGAVDALVPCERPARGKSNFGWSWIKAGKLAILDDEGEPTGEFETVTAHHRPKWPSEGMVQGPRARLAWCVLDAQWFGVAQRRRRVFVVVDFGGACDPAQVLLEPDSLRGDTPPRRETGQGAAGSSGARADDGGKVAAARMVAFGEYSEDGSASALKARDYKDATDLVYPVAFDCKGTDVQYDSSGVSPQLRSIGHNQSHQNAGGHAAIAIQERAGAADLSTGPQGAGYRTDDCAYTLEARSNVQSVAVGGNTTHIVTDEGHDASEDGTGRGAPVVACVFDPNQITSKTNRSTPTPELCHTIPNTAQPPHLFSPSVRRLMPVECARLQGFPDNHTAITYRGKPASDGPQYKAYGNSMARPVIAYILERMKR